MRDHPIDPANEPGLWPPTWPMALTLSRFILLPVFLFVLIGDSDPASDRHRWLAVGIFAVMALTDLLDGYLARRLNQTSHLGVILDPIADKILVTCSMIALAFPTVAPVGYRLPAFLVGVILLKDLVVVAGIFALLRLVGGIDTSPRKLGKLATFLQLSMLVATLIGPDLDRIHPSLGWWITRTLWGATASITLAALVDYVLIGCRHLRPGPVPQGRGPGPAEGRRI